MIRQIRSKVLMTGAAVALVAGLAGGVYAQGDGPGRHGGFGPGGRGAFGHAGFGLRQLDLTDAQRTQVRDVMQRHRDEMQQAGKRLREAHEAQRAAIEAVPVNESLIRSTSQALANAQTDMALLQARVHNEVWSLLTPDQQKKANDLKATRETRKKERLQQRQDQRRQKPQQ